MALTSTQGGARPGYAAPVGGRPAVTPTVPGTSGLQLPGSAQPGFTNPTAQTPRPVAPANIPGGTPTAPAAAPAPAPPAGAPAPLPTLATDPTFLEFTRSLGLSQADAQAAAQQATAAVGARLSNTLAADAVTNQHSLETQAGSMESRGLASSGEALRNQAYLRTQQAFREEALRQQASQQISALATNLALNMQAGDKGLAETGLSTAPTVFAAGNPVDTSSPVGP